VSIEEDAEFQRELRIAIKTFVDGLLEGVTNMSEKESVTDLDPEAEMVAALMDVAIGLCLKRGLPPQVIARAAFEHAHHLARQASTAN
jgi:hypothetical protein